MGGDLWQLKWGGFWTSRRTMAVADPGALLYFIVNLPLVFQSWVHSTQELTWLLVRTVK